jgi:hypothetical protein
VEAVVRGAAGRLVLLYLPTYSPWLNPIEMLWRHFRREVTHNELYPTVNALLTAAQEFFDLSKRNPRCMLSVKPFLLHVAFSVPCNDLQPHAWHLGHIEFLACLVHGRVKGGGS